MRQNSLPLVIGGMAAMAAGMGVGRFIYTPILPVMVEELGMTTSQAGIIASANFMGHIVGALFAASSMFAGSRYRYMLVALVVNALGLVAMGATADFIAQLIIRFIAGAAGAFVLIFSAALVLDRLAASGRAVLSSWHFGGVGAGIAFSAPVIAWLIAQGASWSDLWYASAALAFVGLGVSAWLIPASDPPATSPPAAPKSANPFALRAMIAAYGLFGFGYVITATFIVAIVRGAPEIRALEPYVWTLFGLSAASTGALWMRVSERRGIFQAYAIACVVEAVGVAASILWVSPAGVVVAMLFLGGTVTGLTALGLIAVRNLSVGDPRPNLALATAAFGAGQVVGPTFAGFMHDWLGSFVIPSLVAAFTLFIAGGLALAASSYRPPATSRIAPVT
jgi:predicted MFS family arabinose efflux permease